MGKNKNLEKKGEKGRKINKHEKMRRKRRIEAGETDQRQKKRGEKNTKYKGNQKKKKKKRKHDYFGKPGEGIPVWIPLYFEGSLMSGDLLFAIQRKIVKLEKMKIHS